jgi:hypothetical protein
MTTTLQLDDDLVRRAKAEAERRGTSLDAFVQQILRQNIAAATGAQLGQRIVLPTHNLGGANPGVNFDDGRALRDLLDEDGIARC